MDDAPQARGYNSRVQLLTQSNQFPCPPLIKSIELGFIMDFSAHSILWVLVIGLVVGAIAKLLMPGKDPGGCIITILLGIAGAFVGTWIGRIFAGENYVAGWIMSVVGAMILLLLYRLLFKRGA
jgi:uncharacterized membrane protein YeaQ/YmgE (transglycosylase-associated protein family)